MKKLYGITVAMITPISRDNQSVDFPALEKLTAFLISKGVNCLYCCGTDAEMYHLTVPERKKIAETVVKVANNRVVVYVHCGAMLESDTIELAQHAQMIGADGIGVVTPSYYPMTNKELERYYHTISTCVSCDFPIYLYNIPQLAKNDIKPNIAQNIASLCPNIVGIKYNYPDINQTFDYTLINNGTFSVLQGDDRVLTAWLALGCSGTVAGSANVFPEPLVASYHAFQNGDLDSALHYARIAAEYVDALKGDNIAYFKAGLSLRGLDVGTMRYPLLGLDVDQIIKLNMDLERISLKNGIGLVI